MAGKVRIEDRLGLEHGAGNADQAIGDRPERAAMTVAATGAKAAMRMASRVSAQRVATRAHLGCRHWRQPARAVAEAIELLRIDR